MSSHVLGAGADDPLYIDAKITLSVTPDADLEREHSSDWHPEPELV